MYPYPDIWDRRGREECPSPPPPPCWARFSGLGGFGQKGKQKMHAPPKWTGTIRLCTYYKEKSWKPSPCIHCTGLVVLVLGFKLNTITNFCQQFYLDLCQNTCYIALKLNAYFKDSIDLGTIKWKCIAKCQTCHRTLFIPRGQRVMTKNAHFMTSQYKV